MRPTIVEITNSRKCRLALVSIAQRYARDRLSAASQHVLDVCGKRRVGVNVILDLGSGDAKPHRQSKDVDKLLPGMSDEMRAENSVSGLSDDNFRPGDGFRVRA